METTDATQVPAPPPDHAPPQPAQAAPSFFALLESNLKSDAVAALAKLEAEGKKIVQAIQPIVESTFAMAVAQFRTLAVQTVTNLMTAEGQALTGGEKANLAVTTLLDHAEQNGLALLADDASALVKNAFLAVTELLQPPSGG